MDLSGKQGLRRALIGGGAFALALAFAFGADAGGTIGWADAVGEFSAEGTSVGAAAVVLGIIAVGAILMFGITGLITTVVMVCLGGALMGKAEEIGSALFNGGASGGSIHDVIMGGGIPTHTALQLALAAFGY